MSQFKFYGACKARLDKKGRFSVPASFRNEISPNTFISLHSDNFLEVGEIKDMETLFDGINLDQISVSMTINGTEVSAEVESRTLLVHFIREQASLKGTHKVIAIYR